MSDRKLPADPILVEIVRNGVMAVTEEMKTNLMRTAYNMIIYEALDFTVGIFTKDGDTVSIGLGLPMFIRGMSETVKAKIRHFGADGFEPGDILLTNDAYTTGSHLNHFTFTLPIFHKGELAGFSCCMAHWIDVGGQLGGMTTDIFAEGLQIPIVKYQDRGAVNDTLVEIIRMNVRLPSRAMGDLRAQITAVKTGERLFLQLLDRYGRKEVTQAITAIMDHAEVQARARTRSIPDGVYEAESFMDDDGLEIGKPVPIKVKVVVKGDEMTIDLTDISKQVRGFFNSGPSTSIGLAQMAYKCVTSPTDYPINDGSFRSLKVIAPGADALVDDLSDDGGRHDLQGAATGDPGSGHRRPSRGPRHQRDPRHQSAHAGILHRRSRPARRRLGREADRRRHVGDSLRQRRRHP
jgi:N-methylhydantoinase B